MYQTIAYKCTSCPQTLHTEVYIKYLLVAKRQNQALDYRSTLASFTPERKESKKAVSTN